MLRGLLRHRAPARAIVRQKPESASNRGLGPDSPTFAAFLPAEIGVQFGIASGAGRKSGSLESPMTTTAVNQERRAAQRFEFNLPVRIRAGQTEQCGCTQDVSGRGVFLLLDSGLPEGCHVELEFLMPAEITLTEDMRVRCCGRILRVQRLSHQQKFGIAVSIESYSYLAEVQDHGSDAFDRIACLHGQHEASRQPSPSKRQSILTA